MRSYFQNRGVLRGVEALEKFMNTPLLPINVRQMAIADKEYIRTAIEQLCARTARCYSAFSSDVITRSTELEIIDRVLSLRSLCMREFESCVELFALMDEYLEKLKEGKLPNIESFHPNELSDENEVNTILRHYQSGSNHGFHNTFSESSGIKFLDLLEDLRPHENTLDITVNEKPIKSPELNNWLFRFCRRRVAWRVIHEHLFHLVAPLRYPSVIRVDNSVGNILRHTGTVVASLFAPVLESMPCNQLTIRLEENSALFTTVPRGVLSSSTSIPPKTLPEFVMPFEMSTNVYSVEGHLEYVFRELMKNACVTMLSRGKGTELVVYFASDDSRIVVDVVDVAGGISPEAMQEIWDFGFTTNLSLGTSMSGFGVGLPASKVYADLWGGKIDLYTTTELGTTVRVTFPKAATEVLLPDPIL